MTEQETKAFAQAIAGVIGEYVSQELRPLADRLAAIEKNADEPRPTKAMTLADAYRGQWLAGTTFKRGDLVTYDGSVWLALVDSMDKPGASEAFRLIVKKGRDGKDLRQ